jgi:hypothetical protein
MQKNQQNIFMTNISKFKGVHGTTEQAAKDICKIGFKIAINGKYKSYYGEGIYFYENFGNGKDYALQWGRKIASCQYVVAAIEIDILYDIDDSYSFDVYEFYAFYDNALRKQFDGEKFSSLNPKLRNEITVNYIESIQHEVNRIFKIIFALFKVRYQNKIVYHNGCVVKDVSLLPIPTKYEVDNNG